MRSIPMYYYSLVYLQISQGVQRRLIVLHYIYLPASAVLTVIALLLGPSPALVVARTVIL